MVFSRQQRDPLLPGLNSGDSGCFLDTVSQGAAEVCEEFYDTLLSIKDTVGAAYYYRPQTLFRRS